MKIRGVKLDFTKLNASFPYEKKKVRQRRPLLEGLFQKRDGVNKIDMHETPCGISSGLTENIITSISLGLFCKIVNKLLLNSKRTGL
jgi:hypothetical protein